MPVPSMGCLLTAYNTTEHTSSGACSAWQWEWPSTKRAYWTSRTRRQERLPEWVGNEGEFGMESVSKIAPGALGKWEQIALFGGSTPVTCVETNQLCPALPCPCM